LYEDIETPEEMLKVVGGKKNVESDALSR